MKPEALYLVSLKRDLPAVWKRIEETAAGQEVEVSLPLEASRFSGRYRGLDLRIERVTAFALVRGTLDADALKLLLSVFGAERVALGSDYPFPLGEAEPGKLIESIVDLSAKEKAQLLSETAREFLGL